MPEQTPPQNGRQFLGNVGSSAIWTLLILAPALLIRLLLSDSQSLTMDELFDLETARSGWRGILKAENRFPPLYHWTMFGWWQWVGSDTTGRVFSALCGTTLVAVVGMLGREIGGRTTGWWASLLCAISPFAIWYSLETRVYSLYLLLAAITLWQWALVLRHGQLKNWFWFGLASLAGAYTHYYFALLLVIAAVVYCYLKRSDWPALRTGLLVFSVLAVLCLPDLWFLREDLDQRWGYARTSRFSLPALGYTFFSFFSGYSLGPSLRELHQLRAGAAIVQILPWLVLLGVPVAILSLLGAWPKTQGENRLSAFLFLGAFGIAPILFVGFTSLFASFGYNVRHTLWCYLPLQITVARGIALGRPRWLTTICTVFVCGSSLLAIWNHHYQERYRHEDLRATAQFLIATANPSSPVFVLSGYMAKPLNSYLPKSSWAHPLDTDRGGGGHHDQTQRSGSRSEPVQDKLNQTRAVLSEIERHSRANGTIYLVYTREFHGDPNGKVLGAIRQVYDLQLVASFAGVQVYRGEQVSSKAAQADESRTTL